MKRLYKQIDAEQLSDPKAIAVAYAAFLSNRYRESLIDEKLLSKSPFYVGLSTGTSANDFADLTKRATLVSDTLLLSHDWSGPFHEIGELERQPISPVKRPEIPGGVGLGGIALEMAWDHRDRQRAQRNRNVLAYGMHCPDLANLGQWILDAKPLLEAGLTWYLPSYSKGQYSVVDGARRVDPCGRWRQVQAIDYLVRDRRAVDASGAEPIKGKFVRPILEVELPFLEGLDLRDFSRITVDEFESYSSFRLILRETLLDMDSAIDSTQSERELVKLRLNIEKSVKAARADFRRACTKRWAAAAGATVSSGGAVLVAVWGPALEAAIAALGATGGVWGFIGTISDRAIREYHLEKWHYVWILDKRRSKRWG